MNTTINTYIQYVAGKPYKVTEAYENGKLIAKSYSRIRK